MKNAIKQELAANNISTVSAMVEADRRAMSTLVRLSYDKDTLVGWRAIVAAGLAAQELVRTDVAFLRETCRKLLWSLSDESGGIGWSAPELLGEIVRSDPRQFADLIPLIANVFEIDEKVFRPGVVYALGRIAEAAPGQVLEHQKVVFSALVDRDPLMRYRGLELVGLLWKEASRSGTWSQEDQQKVRQEVDRLAGDREEVWVYQGEGFVSEIVGNIAKTIKNNIK